VWKQALLGVAVAPIPGCRHDTQDNGIQHNASIAQHTAHSIMTLCTPEKGGTPCYINSECNN